MNPNIQQKDLPVPEEEGKNAKEEILKTIMKAQLHDLSKEEESYLESKLRLHWYYRGFYEHGFGYSSLKAMDEKLKKLGLIPEHFFYADLLVRKERTRTAKRLDWMFGYH